jgi:hypothetical protein
MALPPTLVREVHAYYPMPTHGKCEETRLDPPELLFRTTVVVATQWFFQYQCLSVVCFTRAGEQAMYLPALHARDAVTALDRLDGYRLDDRTRWLPHAVATFAGLHRDPRAGGTDERREPIPSAAPDVDLAAWLRADLWRVSTLGDRDLLRAAFGLLDTLATFRGNGSAVVQAPVVLFGTDAVEAVAARRVALASDVRANLLAPVVRPASVVSAGAYRTVAPPSRRHVAVVDRFAKHDGEVGGYDRQLAIASLVVSDAGWRYERNVAWSESCDGAPMS